MGEKNKNTTEQFGQGTGLTLMAVSKDPARMWSTGSWELLHHIWVGLMPLVGGTKKPSSAPPPAPAGNSYWSRGEVCHCYFINREHHRQTLVKCSTNIYNACIVLLGSVGSQQSSQKGSTGQSQSSQSKT